MQQQPTAESPHVADTHACVNLMTFRGIRLLTVLSVLCFGSP